MLFECPHCHTYGMYLDLRCSHYVCPQHNCLASIKQINPVLEVNQKWLDRQPIYLPGQKEVDSNMREQKTEFDAYVIKNAKRKWLGNKHRWDWNQNWSSDFMQAMIFVDREEAQMTIDNYVQRFKHENDLKIVKVSCKLEDVEN